MAVLAEQFEVVSTLRAMQLDHDTLVDIARTANAERALCTSNDVRGFDLITMHDKLARGLRDAFCGKAWEKDETDNQAGIKNVALKLRVIACNFNEDAGNPDPHVQPTNRSPKGAASQKKARCNRTMWIPGFEVPGPANDEITTWVLGVYAEDGEPLRAELSLPATFSGTQYTVFKDRIVLLIGEGNAPNRAQKTPGGEGPVEIIDIAVTRK